MAKCVISPKYFQYYIYIKKIEFYHTYMNILSDSNITNYELRI